MLIELVSYLSCRLYPSKASRPIIEPTAKFNLHPNTPPRIAPIPFPKISPNCMKPNLFPLSSDV